MSLRCIFHDAEQTVHGKIMDISLKGARITLERLQLGSYHVLISDHPISYELGIQLPENDVKIPVEISWYNLDEESRVFFLGLRFESVSNEEKKVLRKAIESI